MTRVHGADDDRVLQHDVKALPAKGPVKGNALALTHSLAAFVRWGSSRNVTDGGL